MKRRRKRILSLDTRATIIETFGRALRNLRLAKGLTTREFETRSGIDTGNLSKYERGDREPGLLIIIMMAKALEVDCLELERLRFESKKSSKRS
jgi:transcriptional regulator with XRE-family HTH domain